MAPQLVAQPELAHHWPLSGQCSLSEVKKRNQTGSRQPNTCELLHRVGHYGLDTLLRHTVSQGRTEVVEPPYTLYIACQ